MVVTRRPSACTASRVQLFTERPSRCTTQAPHWLVSQPTWVPVLRRRSRSASTSSVRASTSTLTGCPFSSNSTLCMGFAPLRDRVVVAATARTWLPSEQQPQQDQHHDCPRHRQRGLARKLPAAGGRDLFRPFHLHL